MPKIVPPPDPTVKEEPGAQIARWLGPVGGGFVLLLSVLMVVFCLTRGANPVPTRAVVAWIQTQWTSSLPPNVKACAVTAKPSCPPALP